MKHIKINSRTSIKHNDSYEGERIETKIERILTSGEPITDGAPLIYTERKDGVKEEYNIRTDRWDIAIDGMDRVNSKIRSDRASRMEIIKPKKDDGVEPTQATNITE